MNPDVGMAEHRHNERCPRRPGDGNRPKGQERKRVHRVACVLEDAFLHERLASVALVEVIDPCRTSHAEVAHDRIERVRSRKSKDRTDHNSGRDRQRKRIVIGNRQKSQTDRTGQKEHKEHDLVNHEGMGTEPSGDGPETKFAAPCEPDVDLMDDGNGERNDEPDVSADSEKLTFTKLFEIDKQESASEQNDHRQQMDYLPFDEEPFGDHLRDWNSMTFLISFRFRRPLDGEGGT